MCTELFHQYCSQALHEKEGFITIGIIAKSDNIKLGDPAYTMWHNSKRVNWKIVYILLH